MAGQKITRRFTVSLEEPDFGDLKRIAESHGPPLSLQYVVRYAVQRVLGEHKGQQLTRNIEQN